jgi:AmmeMemoRadiSam system protein B
MIRLPAVAGRFYPADARELAQQVERFVQSAAPSRKVAARGCVVPHAGYMYSGHVAGAVYASLELPARFIILCPRHYPQGEPLAIISEGAWRTPLGEAEIDSHLAAGVKRACALVREDSIAHRAEHSLEVQLPFLQRLVGDFRFVPIALGTDRFQHLAELGRAVEEVIAAQSDSILVVASSDMNHYESDEITRTKDRKAIDKMLGLDPRGLYDTVRRERISMCGFGPAVTMLEAAKQLGASHAELIRYATSGDVTGDRDEVVGYAGIVVR